MIETALRNLKNSLRQLSRSPGFTAVAILSLALGMGANASIFSLVNAVFLRPLPVEDPKALAAVFTIAEDFPAYLPVSHPNYEDLRDTNTSFTELAAWMPITFALAGDGDPLLIDGAMVSGAYWSALGVDLMLGAGFGPETDPTPGAHPVAVVSYRLWQRQFGGDPQILGRVLDLNGHRFTVTGVAPQGFEGLDTLNPGDLWVPLSMNQQVMPRNLRPYFNLRGPTLLRLVGRLNPSTSLDRAQAEMTNLGAQLEEAHPDANKGQTFLLMSLGETAVTPNRRGGYVQAGTLVMIMVGVVLLIACANIASMLLVRATRRRKETALKLALGARARQLVGELLSESLLIALVAGGLGLVLAVLTQRLIPNFYGAYLPPSLDLSLDGRVVLFTFGLALVTGILFGLIPAIQVVRTDLVTALKGEATANRGGRRWDPRRLLVAGQVALSLAAIVSAVFLLVSLYQKQRVDPGFTTEDLALLSVDLDHRGYGEDAGLEFFRQATEALEALPAVEAVAVAENVALADQGLRRTVVLDGLELPPEESIVAQVNSVAPDYFRLMGIELLQGRAFDDTDHREATAVVILNRTMAERFYPGEDPIGRIVRFEPGKEPVEIVGVVDDIRYNSLSEPPQLYVYLPMTQAYSPYATVHVKTRSEPGALLESLKRTFQETDPTLPITEARTMRAVLFDQLWASRVGGALLTVFGLLALLLASLGIYGLLSYSVVQRRQEIAIRLALGAGRGDVWQLFFRWGLVTVAAGLVLGVGGLFYLDRVLADLFWNIDRMKVWIVLACALALTLVSALAIHVPVRQAAATPPRSVMQRDR